VLRPTLEDVYLGLIGDAGATDATDEEAAR